MELREIDALVAEKVFSLEFVRSNNITGWAVEGRAMELSRYSSDIAAAFEVLCKFEGYEIKRYPQGSIGNNDGYVLVEIFYERWWHKGQSATAPLAICLAALKAKGVEIEMGGVRG